MKKLKKQQDAHDVEVTRRLEKAGPEALSEMKRLSSEPAMLMRNDK
jgi:hypothetical protein